MLEYFSLLARQFQQPPEQLLLYTGAGSLPIPAALEYPTLQFRYRVVDIRELDAAPLLESHSLADNLLAILCRLDDSRAAVRQILARLHQLPPKPAGDALTRLMILSKLRGLPALILEERKRMPIPIDDDILDLPLIRDLVLVREQEVEARGEAKGEIKGEATLLRRQLERRFGSLPQWAAERLQSADTNTLEAWGLRLLEASTLEEVLPASSLGFEN